ncbi:MAG: hypothetical protein JSU03_13485 [Bacteroidetes bacterium]|nr:hypothetical protein [Bacteroidota bacterium]MBS1758282.1 hypothetical protein [Bacteroidota bacterium]
MEDNFYNDDFERFLKENADNFRMYPSKKVWHSLYNDLHPAKRWPSFAISLLLVASVLYLGITNNSSILKNQTIRPHTIVINNLSTNNHAGPFENTTALNDDKKLSEYKLNSDAKKPQPGEKNITGNTTSIIDEEPGSRTLLISGDAPSLHVNKIILSSPSTKALPQVNVMHTLNADKKIIAVALPPTSNFIKEEVNTPGEDVTDQDVKASETLTSSATASNKNNNTALAKNIVTTSQTDKEWYEDYAFHHQAISSRFKKNASFQFYITPSVGFRKLSQNNSLASNPGNNNSSLIVTNPVRSQALNDKITQSSAINIETGTTLLYNISKKIRLKTGVQFNYTSYNVNAIKLSHPVQTYLLLNNPVTGAAYLSPRVSVLANSFDDNNATTLKNNTLQISVPLGADYKITGRNNLKWYVGLDVQPTYITGGHLYALSADEKNYIEDPTLLRKWNMNAAIESFLSFKTTSGIILTLGPQVRYQFRSTYDSRFTYTEKLYNFGLKFGMLTRF